MSSFKSNSSFGSKGTPRPRRFSITNAVHNAILAPAAAAAKVRKRRQLLLLAAKIEHDQDWQMYHNLWKSQWLLAPYQDRYSQSLRRWVRFLMLLAVYEAIYIPLQLCFQEPRSVTGEFCVTAGQLALQYVIDCCFLFDIVVRFHTMLILDSEHGQELISSKLLYYNQQLHSR